MIWVIMIDVTIFFLPWGLIIMLVIFAGGLLLVSAEDRVSLKRAQREIARLQSELSRIKREYNLTLLRINEKKQSEKEKLAEVVSQIYVNQTESGGIGDREFSDNKGNYPDQ